MNEYQRQAETFVWSLLGDAHRRVPILMHWHENSPSKDTSLHDMWRKFITTLLYKRLDLCVNTNGVYLFGCSNSTFAIQFNWLSESEKSTLNYFIHNRETFFIGESKDYHSNHKVLSGFIANKTGFTKTMRRQILRDFCALVYKILPHFRLALYLVLLDVGIAKKSTLCILLSKTLIGYTPDGPSKTPVLE